MKYAAIITYTSGEKTGAVISANSRHEAWYAVLKSFDGGEQIRGIETVSIYTSERENIRG